MPRHRLLPILASALSAFSALSAVNSESAPSPNIVFILADDLGYGELGSYGQQRIKTPHLDRLAAEGLRFTQAYSGAPVCAPARCSLMTGLNLAHAEIRGNKDSGNGRDFPGQWPLTAEALTIAEVLKGAGYATGAFGKWGLGPSDSTGSPIKQGFDRYYGYNCQRNAHSYFPSFLDSDENEEKINPGLIDGHQQKPEGEVNAGDYRLENYAPDMILAEAIKFLDNHVTQNKTRQRDNETTRNTSKPFFLYLPFVEPHVSMQPPQEWIDRYPAEWDEEKGPYRGQNGYLPHPRPRAAYAAMISDLDEHVGAILERLEHHGLTGNTIVIFTSDNGTTHGAKGPAFHVGGADPEFFNSTLDLRGHKGSVYEGGLRVPCIAKWPGHVAPGTTTDAATYFPDWFPTLANLAGAAIPADANLDGIDLASVLAGNKPAARDELMIWEFHNYGGIVAIRDGRWKAIRRDLLSKKGPAPWELYDIDADRSESNDLASQHPEIIRRLEAAYKQTRTPEPDFPIPLYDK